MSRSKTHSFSLTEWEQQELRPPAEREREGGETGKLKKSSISYHMCGNCASGALRSFDNLQICLGFCVTKVQHQLGPALLCNIVVLSCGRVLRPNVAPTPVFWNNVVVFVELLQTLCQTYRNLEQGSIPVYRYITKLLSTVSTVQWGTWRQQGPNSKFVPQGRPNRLIWPWVDTWVIFFYYMEY